ncbi:imidazole glycerol phosphate synthase subunit HisF [Litorimonas taeanensis]|uniref:Imidazole glycerol phosphate synthase subunit HisF n=1 Tax=Litorimonas taeanensis TaxID=568099 RepID=A0A420WK47_9PROT|nr:imidazole glycerol phosphate synthase subunit HisF [Litorimonas taeanensis]RKQ71388.1 imidazole glycerol phosphate synthase subunit HisF [Litorimonas taeanensis]
MLARRIIPCLDVRDGRVVKGVQFRNHEDVGGILDLALRYRDAGADELVFYDITASVDDRSVSPDWVKAVSQVLDIPFCVAGGIKSVQAAGARLAAGADKISINSPALMNPELISELSHAFGKQCIVVGIDSFDDGGVYRVRSHTGDPDKQRETGRQTIDWVIEACDRGAGEIVLNCMNQDGVRQGYDIKQLKAVRSICPVPLIASGGAGEIQHFEDVFNEADVDGALAASVFHKDIIRIPNLKSNLISAGIEIRP